MEGCTKNSRDVLECVFFRACVTPISPEAFPHNSGSTSSDNNCLVWEGWKRVHVCVHKHGYSVLVACIQW